MIGGGILGISTAWHAAQSGLRVALVDAGDFAGATSSASSKLLHGGLRYLQTGAVKLVAENHFERRAVSRQVAPHLANPLTFYLPVYKGGPHGAAKLGAGVFAYSALSAFGDGVGHVHQPRPRPQRDVPELRTENLKAVAVYGDDQMNDARMALMTVRAAVDAGATVLNHAEVTGLRFTDGRVTGAELQGPDGRHRVRRGRPRSCSTPPARGSTTCGRMEDPSAAPSIRLSKGAHLVLKRTAAVEGRAGHPDRQVPHHLRPAVGGHAAARHHRRGVRGRPGRRRGHRGGHRPDPRRGRASPSATSSCRRELITYSFAGLRVLPGGPGDTSKAKRETVVTEGRGGMLSVAGGKWTTFRHIGRTVMNKLAALPGHPLGRGHGADARSCRKKLPLPGIANPNAVAHRLLVDGGTPGPRMAADTARHLATHYGSLVLRHRAAGERATRRWPSASTRTRRRSGRRSSTPATTSGPRRPTTCCAAARR